MPEHCVDTMRLQVSGVVAAIILPSRFPMEPVLRELLLAREGGYMEDLLRVNEYSAAGLSHCAVWASGDSPGA